MSSVVVATFPIEPTVLSGQALRVRTIFDNRGTETVAAPKRTELSAFVYFLRSQTPGGPTYGLSQKATDARRSPDRVSSPPLETEPLEGGGKFEYHEDIAEFWNAGFAPGEYWLTVRLGQDGVESPRTAVTVLPLEIESLSSAVSVDHLSSVVAHRAADGRVSILQRESEVIDPREGDFQVRAEWPTGGAISVSTSIDVVPAGNGRWLAWLRDGKLSAANTWGDRVMRTAEPIDASGTLLSPGFQTAVGTAMFGSVSPEGRLSTYIVSSGGLRNGWGVDLGSSVGKASWNAQADGTITVAWDDAGSGRVLRRSFSRDGQAREATAFAVTPGRPLSWGLPTSGTPTIWVVVLDGTTPVVARLPVVGDRALTRLPELPGASAWDLLQGRGGDAVLVALAGEKVHATRLINPAWQFVADARGASALRLLSLDGSATWAEWVESGVGIRRTRVR